MRHRISRWPRIHWRRAYRAILQVDHISGARILGVTLTAVAHSKRPPMHGPRRRFNVNATNLALEDDDSRIWAWNIEDELIDNYAKMYKQFLNWARGAPPDKLISTVDQLLAESSVALTWCCVFTAGASQPASLGVYLWPLVSHPEFLVSCDTRRSAIALIATVYPHLSLQSRERFETDAEVLNFSEFEHPKETKTRILGRLFAAIGDAFLTTEIARKRLASAIVQGGPLTK